MAETATAPSATQLPQNLEAERALLGGLILDNRLIDVVFEIFPQAAVRQALTGDDHRQRDRATAEPLFFSHSHQIIFRAICLLYEAGQGVDLTTLGESLLTRGQLEAVGGAPYLAGLEDDIFSLGQIDQYAKIVMQKWRLRCLLRASQAIAQEAAAKIYLAMEELRAGTPEGGKPRQEALELAESVQENEPDIRPIIDQLRRL